MRSALVLIALLVTPASASAQQEAAKAAGEKRLLCYAGPSMKAPMDVLAGRYKERTGVRVDVEMNDPRTLISRIAVAPDADLFISHDPFLAMLDRQGVKARGAWTVASLEPVIIVAKGNPRRIRGLADLAREGIRVGVTSEKTAISASIVATMLKRAGVGDAVRANVIKEVAAGRGLATALAADQIDAGVVWNAVAYASRDKVDAVVIPAELRPERGVDSVIDHPDLGKIELDYVRVTIATLPTSKLPEEARAFAEFVLSPEGRGVFEEQGFAPADPDRPTLPTDEEKMQKPRK